MLDGSGVTGLPLGFDLVVSLMNQTAVSGFSGADYTDDINSLGNGTLVGTLAAGDSGPNELESFALTGQALTQFAGLFDPSGTPSQSEVFFRLSISDPIDTTDPVNDNDRFNLERSGDPLLVTRTLTIETAPIPEPSTVALTGFAVLGLLRRRR